MDNGYMGKNWTKSDLKFLNGTLHHSNAIPFSKYWQFSTSDHKHSLMLKFLQSRINVLLFFFGKFYVCMEQYPSLYCSLMPLSIKVLVTILHIY